jgi:hypothetical protein
LMSRRRQVGSGSGEKSVDTMRATHTVGHATGG